MGIYQSHRIAIAAAPLSQGFLGNEWRSSFPGWFQQIPPERVGLNGEYDYYGLQKRVESAFRQQFSARILKGLTVHQRGRVIILEGAVMDRTILDALIETARCVEGTYRVETYGVVCYHTEDYRVAV
jgi:hypothetical protein